MLPFPISDILTKHSLIKDLCFPETKKYLLRYTKHPIVQTEQQINERFLYVHFISTPDILAEDNEVMTQWLITATAAKWILLWRTLLA